MKGTSKNLKGKDVKNENSRVTEANGSSTPKISARSRQSLDGFTAQREDEGSTNPTTTSAITRAKSTIGTDTTSSTILVQSNGKTWNLSSVCWDQPKAIEQCPANTRTKHQQTKTPTATRPRISSRAKKSNKKKKLMKRKTHQRKQYAQNLFTPDKRPQIDQQDWCEYAP